jgi:hypothetical protein
MGSGFRVGYFRLRSEEDLKHAIWLMRLSYVRYVLKTDNDPRARFERESEELHLSPRFTALLAQFVPAFTKSQQTSLA